VGAGLVSLRYFILGLLAQQSMSGYDIKCVLKGLSWLTGSPSGGNLYPVLRALHAEDLVTVEIVPGRDRPTKKVYTINEAGRRELQVWIDQPAAPDRSLKAFVMLLLLASNFSTGVLMAHLQQRRAQVAAHHGALCQAACLSQTRDNVGRFLAMDYGLAMASAEQSWLDDVLGDLSEQSPLSDSGRAVAPPSQFGRFPDDDDKF
jgi:DNA-binding PadR family transcriptional regulator